MKVTDFANLVAKLGKGKVEVNITQIMGILNKANKLTKGFLYDAIHALSKKDAMYIK